MTHNIQYMTHNPQDMIQAHIINHGYNIDETVTNYVTLPQNMTWSHTLSLTQSHNTGTCHHHDGTPNVLGY